VVARLGLHYWVSWIFKTLVAREEVLKKSWWQGVDRVYFIKQKKGIVPFGTAGLFGIQFPEPNIPEKAVIIYDGKFYSLHEVNNPPGYLPN